MIRLSAFAAAAALSALMSTGAWADEHQVKMLNKDSEGRAMQFEPAFLKIAPGDTVVFVAVDKAHNTESINSAVPEGGETWKGKTNEEVEVTLQAEGLYAYKCLPHQGLGMVGLIQVGESTANLAAVEAVKLPPKAKARMDELVAAATGSGATN